MLNENTMQLITFILLFLGSCRSSATKMMEDSEPLATDETDKMFYCDTSEDALDPLPTTRSSTDIGGDTRYWYTYKPPTSTEPVPLVLDLHGYFGCASGMPPFSGWRDRAAEEGFYLIWPQGTNNIFIEIFPCWNAGTCCCSNDSIPDSEFIRRMIYKTIAESEGKIDPKRVYIGGHSNGCFMSQTFVADYPGVVAGVACHAGVMGQTHPNPDDPDWIPTAIVTVHGDEDDVIPYNSNPFYFGVEENIDLWGASNGCTKKEIVPDPGNDYVTHTWTGCDRGVSTQLIQVLGAGHDPYASDGYVDTTAIAWNYLKNFSLDPDCQRGTFYLMVEVFTDDKPIETSWTLARETPDNVVFSKDDYSESNFKYTIGSCARIGCYIFTIFDSSGDGLFGDSGYKIFGNGNVIAEGSFDNGFEESVTLGC